MIAAIPYWNPYSADRQQRRAREQGGWPGHPTPGIEEVFHRRVLNRHETAEELRHELASVTCADARRQPQVRPTRS